MRTVGVELYGASKAAVTKNGSLPDVLAMFKLRRYRTIAVRHTQGRFAYEHCILNTKVDSQTNETISFITFLRTLRVPTVPRLRYGRLPGGVDIVLQGFHELS